MYCLPVLHGNHPLLVFSNSGRDNLSPLNKIIAHKVRGNNDNNYLVWNGRNDS